MIEEFIHLIQQTCKIGTAGVVVILLLAVLRLVILKISNKL